MNLFQIENHFFYFHNINISENKITCKFRGKRYYGSTTYYVDQNLLFSTSEEAQRFCDEQNSLNA